MFAEFFNGFDRSGFEGSEEALFQHEFLFNFLKGFVFYSRFASFAIDVGYGRFETVQQLVKVLSQLSGIGHLAIVVVLCVNIVAFGFDLFVACYKVFEVTGCDVDVGSGVYWT
jgi:hypothetical protein